MFSDAQNKAVLTIMENTLMEEQMEPEFLNLAEYIGGTITVNPPTDESSYDLLIKQPMLLIFDQLKTKLEANLGKVIYNNPFEPLNNNQLYFNISLITSKGNFMFCTSAPDTIGRYANTFANCPLQSNTINGSKSTDNAYSPYFATTNYCTMMQFMDPDPTMIMKHVLYNPQNNISTFNYSVCCKLINNYTGVVGGTLEMNLFNVADAFLFDSDEFKPRGFLGKA